MTSTFLKGLSLNAPQACATKNGKKRRSRNSLNWLASLMPYDRLLDGIRRAFLSQLRLDGGHMAAGDRAHRLAGIAGARALPRRRPARATPALCGRRSVDSLRI